MENLSKQELDERVALLKKIRSLLEMQRNKFRDYLKVLEKQEDSINNKDSELIASHADLEVEVLKGISNLQKVIIPMKELYKATGNVPAEIDDKNINLLQEDLKVLQEKVLVQNKKNRELLRVNLTQIKTQMEQFKNPYRNLKSVYAQKVPSGNFVEIQA